MTTTITLAGRVLRRDQIALVEAFDPAASKLENAAGSQARVILSNGRNFLIPQTPAEFAEANGFRHLQQDNLALNPGFDFRVRTYNRAEGQSSNARAEYQTEISWGEGLSRQWKNLKTDPDAVAAAVFSGKTDIVPIHRDRVPLSDVVLVEAFSPKAGTTIANADNFHGTVVLANGRTILSEETPAKFAEQHGFNHLNTMGDDIAVNPKAVLTLEAFDTKAAQDRNPNFIAPKEERLTRLAWGSGGAGESKLLRSDPKTAAKSLFKPEQVGSPVASKSAAESRPAPK